eukprot:1348366-Pyramimonas_sp.AAC.1
MAGALQLWLPEALPSPLSFALCYLVALGPPRGLRAVCSVAAQPSVPLLRGQPVWLSLPRFSL